MMVIRKNQGEWDVWLVYVAYRCVALGDMRRYLRGVPRAIAPSPKTQVPMKMSFSPGFARQQGLDLDCVRQAADELASQDNLFPTILGMFQVRTGIYDPKLDLLRRCEHART